MTAEFPVLGRTAWRSGHAAQLPALNISEDCQSPQWPRLQVSSSVAEVSRNVGVLGGKIAWSSCF